MDVLSVAIGDFRASKNKALPIAQHIYGVLNQVTALILIVLASPLLLFIAWRIWQVDGAPIMYGQYRVGRGGKLFRCLKFRSMVKNADQVLAELLLRDPHARAQWERDQKLHNDPRITRIGHFLRRSSLDELPQLFNVLRGQMLLVGPRPIVVPELRRYGAAKHYYLAVKPGMTGLWQVSGRNNTTYEERVQFDRKYVEQRSIWFDLSILAKTVQVVATGHGAR